MKNLNYIFLLVGLGLINIAQAQIITGKIIDSDKNPLIGAYIVATEVKGVGGISDEKGNFTVKVPSLPISLKFSYLGFEAQTITVQSANKPLTIILSNGEKVLTGTTVRASRVSEKQKEQPLTVESMGLKAIQDAPSASFYESLGNLKGVDVTAASLGFRVINTRGFNSTSPVRSLQLIDGVDNQSPGLNFSLGNFLGASDLDIRRVDIIAGASSAFYGPNAFNGVVSMSTKSAFDFPGVSAEFKYGERSLTQIAARYANFTKDKAGKKRFGYKINLLAMRANDWEAENYAPTTNSVFDASNPGGYDAVNVYGDEVVVLGNDYRESSSQFENPGLGYFHRSGYQERDLVNYNTNNIKLNTALSYRFTDDLDLTYAFNFSGGSTVYQGDNRYKLEDIRFWQNRLELTKSDKYFVRLYSTNEDAGKSYDAVATAFRLNDGAKTNEEWNRAYVQNWRLYRFRNQVQRLPDYPSYNGSIHGNLDNWADNFLTPFLGLFQDSLNKWHSQNRGLVDEASGAFTQARFTPGTERFDSAFSDITGRLFTDGGTRFFDQSALYHSQGQYIFTPSFGKITVGGNARLYRPNSQGTILEDTGNVVITNREWGVYSGIEKRLMANQLIVNATARLDKNQNFDFLVSPAASAVYKLRANHVLRLSFSSAIRNPTLADQYLYYDVGRARLLGNLNGFDSLITVESFNDYRAVNLDLAALNYFNVAPIRPEKAKTIELGYKGNIFNQALFMDAEYYFTNYQDFIGYNIGLDVDFDPVTRLPNGGIQAYRVAANAQNSVTTQGVAIGLNYFFSKYALGGNYSWNVLNKKGTDDPIIPAFNTPAHKFNLSLNGNKLKFPFVKGENLGFGINYKWIQGFIFEGSPQFTGFVPSYDMLDAQINYAISKYDLTIKIGGSNILGFSHLFQNQEFSFSKIFKNQNYQVYGGPLVGRLIYVSILWDIKLPREQRKQ